MAEISAEIDRTEKLEATLAQCNSRIDSLEYGIDSMVQSSKNCPAYKDLEAECNGLRKELEALKAAPKNPTSYWEVTVTLRDGRIGTYSIIYWPHHIKADEVFRNDVTLSLRRVVPSP
jgi:hypothetical protein